MLQESIKRPILVVSKSSFCVYLFGLEALASRKQGFFLCPALIKHKKTALNAIFSAVFKKTGNLNY